MPQLQFCTVCQFCPVAWLKMAARPRVEGRRDETAEREQYVALTKLSRVLSDPKCYIPQTALPAFGAQQLADWLDDQSKPHLAIHWLHGDFGEEAPARSVQHLQTPCSALLHCTAAN